MSTEIEKIISILSNGKFEILKTLLESPKTHSELCKQLNISPPTISRSMRNFCECELVEKNGNQYNLTGFGYYLTEYLLSFEELTKHCSFIKFSLSFSRVIPVELKSGILRLKTAERIESSERVLKILLNNVECMKYGLFILKVNLKDLINEICTKCESGAKAKIIVPKSIGKCINSKNLEVKVIDNLPLQLAVIDYKMALIHIVPDKTFSSVYYLCKDKKCIKWIECLFDHFWDLST